MRAHRALDGAGVVGRDDRLEGRQPAQSIHHKLLGGPRERAGEVDGGHEVWPRLAQPPLERGLESARLVDMRLDEIAHGHQDVRRTRDLDVGLARGDRLQKGIGWAFVPQCAGPDDYVRQSGLHPEGGVGGEGIEYACSRARIRLRGRRRAHGGLRRDAGQRRGHEDARRPRRNHNQASVAGGEVARDGAGSPNPARLQPCRLQPTRLKQYPPGISFHPIGFRAGRPPNTGAPTARPVHNLRERSQQI